MRSRLKTLSILEPILLILVPVILLVCAVAHIEQAALVSLVVVIAALVPFFLRFELSGARPRDIMPIVVMSALAAAGRVVFAPFPNVKPVSAIVIVSGLCFGRQAGFLTGALAALVSNIFFGQGPWTPWQMYAWGLIGYVAGFIAERALLDRSPVVYTYGFLSGLLFGFIMDSYYLVGFISPLTAKAALAAYGMGLPFSLAQSIATVVFLIPILAPWRVTIGRIRRKYGILRQGTSEEEPPSRQGLDTSHP